MIGLLVWSVVLAATFGIVSVLMYRMIKETSGGEDEADDSVVGTHSEPLDVCFSNRKR